MRIQRVLGTALAAIAFFAWGVLKAEQLPEPEPDFDSPQVVSGLVIVERDDFEKTTLYRGPIMDDDSNNANDRFRFYLMAAKEGNTETSNYVIIIHNIYIGENRRSYTSAYDSNGNRLGISNTVINKVESCQGGTCVTLTVLTFLTRAYLEKNLSSGIRFQIRGKRGEKKVLFIPSGYIRGFLAAVDKEK